MTLKEIYIAKRKVLDACFLEFYNTLKQDIENDEDFTLADDELDELIIDLMLSNVLGEVITFDTITGLLKNSKKLKIREAEKPEPCEHKWVSAGIVDNGNTFAKFALFCEKCGEIKVNNF